MRQLGMPVSDDTILRHLKRSASRVDDDPPARIIGIDDWSWRKSWRYGTIIVDLERRKVMDILRRPEPGERCTMVEAAPLH